MNIPQLESTLRQVTAEHCGHEERKGVLGMSNLHLRVEEILERYRNGYHPDEEQKLKLFQGTQSEIGMRGRLEIVCKKLGLVWGEPRVLSAYDGWLTGHTDGDIDGETAVEIKTVPNAEILFRMKSERRVPYKVVSQVNAYCLWGGYKDGLVVYETRNEGLLWLVEVKPSDRIRGELQAKATSVLAQIRNGGLSRNVAANQPQHCGHGS